MRRRLARRVDRPRSTDAGRACFSERASARTHVRSVPAETVGRAATEAHCTALPCRRARSRGGWLTRQARRTYVFAVRAIAFRLPKRKGSTTTTTLFGWGLALLGGVVRVARQFARDSCVSLPRWSRSLVAFADALDPIDHARARTGCQWQ